MGAEICFPVVSTEYSKGQSYKGILKLVIQTH